MSARKRVTRSLIAQDNLETTEGHYSPVRLEHVMLGSSLLYGTLGHACFESVSGLRKHKYTAYHCFYGNALYGEIPTKKEPIRTLGLTSRLPCHILLFRPRLAQKSVKA